MKYSVSENRCGDTSPIRTTWYKYQSIERHRENNLPADYIDDNSYIVYVVDGHWHRTDGPARIFDDDKEYRLKGVLINVSSDEEFIKYQKLQAFS